MKKCFNKMRIMIDIMVIVMGICVLNPFAVEGKEKIKVGYIYNNKFSVRSNTCSFSGRRDEYLSEIAKYTGWEYEYIPGTWSECLARLENGTIDLLGYVQYTAERAQKYDYTQKKAGIESIGMHTKRNKKEIYFEDFAGFNGLRIGMIKDSVPQQVFEAYQRQHGFQVQEVFFDSVEALMLALEKESIDGIVNGTDYRKIQAKTVANVKVMPYYFITKKGNDHIMQPLNKAMKQIEEITPYFEASLYKEYDSDRLSIYNPGFTKEEVAFIQNHPAVKVVYGPDRSPMMFFKPETNAYAGISADIMQMIAEHSGLKFEYIQSDSYLHALEKIKAGEADVIACVGKKAGLADLYHFILTKPYLDIQLILIGKRSTVQEKSHIEKKSVMAIPDSFVGAIRYAERHYPMMKVVMYQNVDQCLQAIRKGEADYTLISRYTLEEKMNQGCYKELGLISTVESNFPMCIGVQKDQDALLLSIFNKSIVSLGEQEINRCIANNTINKPYPIQLKDLIFRYLGAFLLSLTMIIVLVLKVILHYRRRREAELEHLAYFDPITGEKNAEKFRIDVEKRLHENQDQPFSIIVFDLNKFKVINDMYGLERGDDVLRYMAMVLRETLAPDAIFARQDADVFSLLVCTQSDKEILCLLDTLDQKLQQYALPFKLSPSYGIYKITSLTLPVRIMYDRANLAKKTIKGNVNICYAFYNDEVRSCIIQEKSIEDEMNDALENHSFKMYLQPKYTLTDRKIVGAEALVRWEHPERGMIAPGEFIPIFERNGFIEKLDFYIWEQACKTIRKWMDQGLKPIVISVNISRNHLHEDDFIEKLKGLLLKYQVPSHMLELELTESTFFSNMDKLFDKMKILRKMGHLIDMDDFGSGYSSLNLLKDLPLDVIKIDRCFLNEAVESTRGGIILSSVIAMAKKLNLMVISEGIETMEQENMLKKFGCDLGQGYYFAKPMTIEDLEGRLF